MRLLVSTVERWRQVGEPTPAAQLAQIEALLDLCMMDRAWTRLQSLPATGTSPLQRAKLTARMFLARGWATRAAEAVEEAKVLDPSDPEVAELARRATRPPPPPMLEAPDADAPLKVQLAAAETFLATGAFLKARRLLERLDRTHPGQDRVADLLWALQGDYDLSGATLHDVVAHHGVHVGQPEPDTDTVEATEVSQDLLHDEAGRSAFPILFRGGQADDDVALGDVEDTQTMRLGDFQEDIPTSVHDHDEDTQVMRVVSGAGARPAIGPGPATAPDPEELEEEDDVVVLVRRREDQPPPKARRPLPSPVVQRRRKRPAQDAEPVDMDHAAIEDLEATPVSPGQQAPRVDNLPYLWIALSAFILGASGLALLATVLWTLARAA